MQSKGLENYELRRRQTYCWYKEGSLFKDDDAVDPHLERIKNEVGGDESDEEVIKQIIYIIFILII